MSRYLILLLFLVVSWTTLDGARHSSPHTFDSYEAAVVFANKIAAEPGVTNVLIDEVHL